MALLLVVTTAIMTIVISSSNEQIYSEMQTASEAIDKSTKKVAELVSLISIHPNNSDGITLDLLNYGKRVITIEKVMIDGVESTYSIYKSSDGSPLGNTLPVRELVTVQVPKSGKTIQILTDSGNLFDFST